MTSLSRSLLLGAETRQRHALLLALALAVPFLTSCAIPITRTHTVQISVRIVENDEPSKENPDIFSDSYIDPSFLEFSPKQAWEAMGFETPYSLTREPWRARKGGRK
jgi:hypothetical protein